MCYKYLAVVVVLIYCIGAEVQGAETGVFRSKQLIKSERNTVRRDNIFNNTRYIYVTYDSKSKCMVYNITAKAPAFDGALFTTNCNNVTVCSPTSGESKVTFDHYLHHLGANRLLLVVMESNWSANISLWHKRIIDLNTCAIANCDHPSNRSIPEIRDVVSKPYSVEFFHYDRIYCNGSRLCKQQCGNDGKPIEESQPFLLEQYPLQISLVNVSEPAKGYAVFAIDVPDEGRIDDTQDMLVLHIDKFGKTNEIAKIKEVDIYRVKYSHNDELFGFCSKLGEARFRCYQTDAKSTRLNVTVTTDEHYGLFSPFGLYNLGDGALMFAAVMHNQLMYIYKIDGTSQLVKKMAINVTHDDRIKHFNSARLEITESDMGEYCFHYSCVQYLINDVSYKPDEQEYYYETRCIPKKYVAML